MLKQFLYAAALPLKMAGLFAIWNWSRRSRAFAWVLLGSAILLSFAGLVASVANSFGGRFYASFFGMYLFSELMWASDCSSSPSAKA